MDKFKREGMLGLLAYSSTLKITHETIAQRINCAVERKLLATCPCTLHDRSAGKALDLLAYAQVAQEVGTFIDICNGIQFFGMLLRELGEGIKPVIDEAELLAVDDRPYTAAAMMAAHNHMFYLEYIDSKLQNRKAVQIARIYKIGYIAVNENSTRLKPGNDIRRHPAV